MSFRDKVLAREAGILTYGLTPPRAAQPAEKLAAIAERQRAALQALPVDALILYDLQDESGRDPSPRPFEFLPTLDPFAYARDYLHGAGPEVIVYRAVANHEPEAFAKWLSLADRALEPAAVSFVGSPTRSEHAAARLGLRAAYELYRVHCQRLLLGGICIAERHRKTSGEHLRVLEKQALGCSFFVSQAVYDPATSQALLSDLASESARRGLPCVPLLLTITPCGSEKVLDFMKWLGISFDPEIEQRLLASSDMLGESVLVCEELIRRFVRQSSGPVPLGINVESVSIRRADIEAADALVRFAHAELARHSGV